MKKLREISCYYTNKSHSKTISDMHHPALQSDFQPPYFPPPFHHTTQSPPQQQNHGTHGIEYLGAADPYGHVVS